MTTMGRIQVLIVAAVFAALLVAAAINRGVDAKPTSLNSLEPIADAFQEKQASNEQANQQTILLRTGQGILGSQDPYNLVSLDDGLTFQQAVIVLPDPLYGTIPGTQWISCAQSKLDPCGLHKTVLYRSTFLMPDDFQAPSLTVILHADNGAEILLNGTLIGRQQQGELLANFQDPPEIFTSDVASLFRSGTNSLDFRVRDGGGVDGLDLQATVTFAGGTAPATYEANGSQP